MATTLRPAATHPAARRRLALLVGAAAVVLAPVLGGLGAAAALDPALATLEQVAAQ